jgi:predicted glycogen debranching enzyme
MSTTQLPMSAEDAIRFVSDAEWLETDGLGGYAMGRADGVRTRRYHAVLTAARTPPGERMTLVNGFDAWVEYGDERIAITSQRYVGDVLSPDSASRLEAFTTDPWPTWRYRLPDGTELVQELVMEHGSPLVALAWHCTTPCVGELVVRPFMSVRDTHTTTHENTVCDMASRVTGDRVQWMPYAGLPGITAVSSGSFTDDAVWYRDFQYDEERARGQEFTEDLWSPGEFRLPLHQGHAVLAFGADTAGASPLPYAGASALWDVVTRAERTRRAAFTTPLHRAGDAYVVRRGDGRTIVAGYPWFTDWGRDTFIAMRGLCIAAGRLDDARAILLEWAGHVSEGMLPNFFPENSATAEFNSVDASLWFVIAAHEYLQAADERRTADSDAVAAGDAAVLRDAVLAIVHGYARGTRFGIRVDGTGLLCAGVHGVQLTWMDAKVGDWVVTPRIGKPVEVQALWINALHIASQWEPSWSHLEAFAQDSFTRLFWNEEAGCLFDVVDVDHVHGRTDASLRPNQLFAVGGLPIAVVHGERARRVIDVAEVALWTEGGARSLAAHEVQYVGNYAGDMWQRDGAYHEGTVWPWLAGAFVEGWVRVRGATDDVKDDARARFLKPLLSHFHASSPGQLGEIADGDAPFRANGCPFQAWSVGEAIRLSRAVLAVATERGAPLDAAMRTMDLPTERNDVGAAVARRDGNRRVKR